jgi:flagellar protein FliS
MVPPKAHNQYLQTKVLTASKEQLVLMLFDGAIRFSEVAKKAWADKDIEAGHNAMIRVQNIILELTCSLDKGKGGEIATNMADLYNYCYRQLVQANIDHDAALVDEAMTVIRELRDAWAQAMDIAGTDGKHEEQVNLSATTHAPVKPVAAAPKPASKILGKLPSAPTVGGADAANRPRLSVQG